MQFKTGDIIIFRKKKLMHALYSMITLNLDNHVEKKSRRHIAKIIYHSKIHDFS